MPLVCIFDLPDIFLSYFVKDRKNTRSGIKKVATFKQKGEKYVRNITYTNQGHSSAKVNSVIDFTDESFIKCDV